MSFPHEIFKAYDIRGIVATALTAKMVEQIGRAIGTEALAAGDTTMVVGRDGRLSGPELVNALSAGIMATGCHVVDIGMVPTPTLYHATKQYGGSGVQVTGSHNPPAYNGLKMMVAGETLAGERIQILKQRVLDGDFTVGQGQREERSVLAEYVAQIVDDIDIKRPMKIVVDCGNGVAGDSAPDLYRKLGCEVIELFCEVDGTFPNHHPDPSQLENLQDLIAAVAEHDADMGFAFDGDGDRLGVVSREGQVIWPDRQMQLFSAAILEQQPGAEIIFDVKCSQVLPAVIKQLGGRPLMWKTGHSFIKAKLKETGAAMAGEMSGHIFFNDRWGGFDDGLYAGARLLELLSVRKESPTVVFNALPDTVNTPELRLDMAEGEHYGLVDDLVKAASFDDATVSNIDGLRVDFDDGFGLLRASNTTPTIIMRFEATSEAQLNAIQQRFRDLFHTVRPDLALPF